MVLTHGTREPSSPISELSEICEQVVIVQDSRFGDFDHSLLSGVNLNCAVTVLERPFDGFPGQRNAGIEQAAGQWVLSLDSDERLSAELSHEIVALEPPDDVAIYAMPKQERLKGRPLKVANPSGLLNPLHPRLFRSNLRYAEQPLVHERFVNKGQHQIVPLNGYIEHFPDEGVFQLWFKAFKYGQLRSSQAVEQGSFEYSELLSNLRQFILEDGLGGAAMVGAKIAYGLGVKTSKSK